MVQYYEVVCKGGHVGSNNYFPMHLFIAAENGREAAAIARQAPRVKHDRKDSIISVCPLPYEDYIAGRHEHLRNGYYRSHSKQEMLRLCPNISEQIIPEDGKSDGDVWTTSSGCRWNRSAAIQLRTSCRCLPPYAIWL